MLGNKQVHSYNDDVKNVRRSTANEKRIPNVASMSDKKASQMLHNGTAVKKRSLAGYSFATTSAKDQKTLNHQKNKAIEEYRKAIADTMKILEGA